MRFLRLALLNFVALSMIGCTTVTVRKVDLQPPKQAANAIPESQLLDVGIVVFDSNIPETYDELVEANVTEEVRRAEANWIANYLKDYLQNTGNWGAVRVIPEPSLVVDIVINGRILHSDGNRQVLEFNVVDSRGVVWLDETFDVKASKFAYDLEVSFKVDPFQTTYRELSDKLLAVQEALTPDEVLEIRNTTLIKYGKAVVPDAFGDYIVEEKGGRFTLNRVPTTDDPTMAQVEQLLERELLLIDTLDEYFDRFAEDMHEPYLHWRKETHAEARVLEEELARSKTRFASGVLMALFGAIAQRQMGGVTEIAGYSGVIGGATEILGGLQDRANAKIHQERLQELGNSIARELSPVTIELENATISLQGTYSQQFDKAIQYIRESYQLQLGNTSDIDSSADDSTGAETTDEFIQDSE